MKKEQNGFILPMIVVTGLVLMVVMAFTLQTISISRDNLINQRAQLLARQAAESGLARAQQCLQKTNQVVRWTKEKPLRPNTDCYGEIIAGQSEYVANSGSYKSKFEVYPSDMHDDFRTASSVGTVEFSRGGSSLSGYSHTTSAFVQTGLTFDDIAFGSIYGFGTDLYSGNARDKQEGVYFFTKTLAGTVNGVGSNLDDVLTGYYLGDGQGYPKKGSASHPGGMKVGFPSGTKVSKIFTDFQGNGWNAYFLTHDNKIYGTGVNGNAMLANGVNTTNPYGGSYIPKDLPIWGTPVNNYSDSEAMIQVPNGEKAARVIFNGATAYLLTESKKLYGFGRNWNGYDRWGNVTTLRGMIGCYQNCNNGRIEFINTPRKVQVTDNGHFFDSDREFNVVTTDMLYTAVQGTVCAIDTSGRVYCWGWNEHHQISNTDTRLFIPYGIRVGMFGTGAAVGKAVDVKTDSQTVYVLTDKGKVYAGGNGEYGQTGRTCASNKCSLAEINFPAGVKIVKMAVDAFSALFLAENGKVYGLGLNDVGQLGNGSTIEKVLTPSEFILPADQRAVDIFIVSPGVRKTSCPYYDPDRYKCEAIRYRNSLVITEDGSVYAAGSNYYGQLGVGNRTGFVPAIDHAYYNNTNPDIARARQAVNSNTSMYVAKPVKMYLAEKDFLTGVMLPVKAKYVRAGLGMSIVITNKNRVYTVGHNHNGQLGSGDTIDQYVPKAHRLTNQWNVWYY